MPPARMAAPPPVRAALRGVLQKGERRRAGVAAERGERRQHEHEMPEAVVHRRPARHRDRDRSTAASAHGQKQRARRCGGCAGRVAVISALAVPAMPSTDRFRAASTRAVRAHSGAACRARRSERLQTAPATGFSKKCEKYSIAATGLSGSPRPRARSAPRPRRRGPRRESAPATKSPSRCARRACAMRRAPRRRSRARARSAHGHRRSRQGCGCRA